MTERIFAGAARGGRLPLAVIPTLGGGSLIGRLTAVFNEHGVLADFGDIAQRNKNFLFAELKAFAACREKAFYSAVGHGKDNVEKSSRVFAVGKANNV